MIILKTKSQLKNFVKRMDKKYSYYHDEGCGCCTTHSTVNITYTHGNQVRVVHNDLSQLRGSFKLHSTVLAVIRKKSLVNHLKTL